MPEISEILPCRRPELIVRPLGERGEYVVKDPRAGSYYHLGEEEQFLFDQLNGRFSAGAVRAAFEDRFAKPLSEEELDEFLEMSRAQGFLEPASGGREPPGITAHQGAYAPRSPGSPGEAPLGLRILYWRKSLFDPDRLFNWLEPHIRFFWTTGFLVFSLACILLAAGVAWTSRSQMASSFVAALHWESAFWVVLVMAFVTLCHEFAHGLTCKHYGGEVHEVGFLMLLLMPCFYCNVSDAWLFREKSKRLWVTLAGAYFELFLWALAVFAWRLTLPGTLPHYLAFVLVSASGIQTLFNFNPLIKLDGYYLLSDWLEIPNLQKRAGDYVKGRLRWLFWGAEQPRPESRGGVLLAYGLVSWIYSLAMLALVYVALLRTVGPRGGIFGLAGVGLLGFVSTRGLFHNVSAGEVSQMIRHRRTRTAGWVLFLGAVPALLTIIPWEDRVGGSFQVRPALRCELRAAVAGFIQSVQVGEGDRVEPGKVVVRLEVPDLTSRLAQKRAEVSETRAKLSLLRAGPRPEEVLEQKHRVDRARAWRDQAERDLARTRKALDRELARLDEQIAQYDAELNQARASFDRAQRLLAGQTGGVISLEEYGEARKRYQVCRHQVEQARDQKQARQALGAQEAEAELAKRDKDLADVQGALTLLQAGTRPEEVEAEKARLARLQEEAAYLEGLQRRLVVQSPAAGVITTPHLKEKVGQYVREGDLMAVVEEPEALEVEITLAEQDVARVQPGQAVALKLRALPYETFSTRVDRIAPAAAQADVQGTVLVACRLTAPGPELRPGMTGYARIDIGRRSAGAILLDRGLRYVRTEFWW